MPPSRPADAAVGAGRWIKAQEFAEAAHLHRPIDDEGVPQGGDIYVTLAVHAGIAAADVICIGALGEYSATGAHDEALQLIGKVDSEARTALARLLALKTKAGYTHRHVSRRDVPTAEKALEKMMDAASGWARARG